MPDASRSVTLPAPTAGWYVGDNQATPPPKTAVSLNNAFPQLDYVRARGGSQPYATDLGAAVSSLLVWTSGRFLSLFAVSGGAIFDVSNSGPAGAPEVVGLSTSYLQACQFQGFGGSYLIAVDGADDVQIYDGNGWNETFPLSGVLNSTTAVTGLSSTGGLQVGMALSGTGIPPGTTVAVINSGTAITLSAAATVSATETLTFYQNAPITGYPDNVPGFSFVWQYKGRLYFVYGSTLDVYYLGLASIGGPATKFPLAPFFIYGGYIIAGGTWAVDSTAGAFEACAFISSEGEILMYSGSFPGGSDWTLIGQYKISRPLGQNCLMKAGGDLLIMTEDGIVAMSKVMTLDQVALENVAVSKPIAPAWRDAVIARAGLPGWQIVSWPLQSMVVVNLPKQNSADYTQFVANSRTGAWTQYIGWDANCFAVFNNQLFYGDSLGNVLQGETGGADGGTNNYTVTIMLGFSDFGVPVREKQVRLVKPYVQSAYPTSPQISIAVDYNLTLPQAPPPAAAIAGALWDTAVWDADVWGGGLTSQTGWLDAQGLGTALSVCYQVTMGSGLVTPDIRIAAFDVIYEAGSIGPS